MSREKELTKNPIMSYLRVECRQMSYLGVNIFGYEKELNKGMQMSYLGVKYWVMKRS